MQELDNEVDDRAIAIAMLRAFRDMTQGKLAGAGERTRPTVSAAEAGRQSSQASTFEQALRGVEVDEELGNDLVRWVRRARIPGRPGAPPPSRRRLAEAAAAELTDALEELLNAADGWIEERRQG